jgi:hypothetical protein
LPSGGENLDQDVKLMFLYYLNPTSEKDNSRERHKYIVYEGFYLIILINLVNIHQISFKALLNAFISTHV